MKEIKTKKSKKTVKNAIINKIANNDIKTENKPDFKKWMDSHFEVI